MIWRRAGYREKQGIVNKQEENKHMIIHSEQLNYKLDHVADRKLRAKKPEKLPFRWVFTAKPTGEMSLRDPDEVFEELDRRDTSLYCSRFGDSGFVVFFNPDEVIDHNGHRYCIGSIVIAMQNMEDDTIHTLTEYDISDAIIAFTDRLTELSIGEMAYKMAIDIDGRTFS